MKDVFRNAVSKKLFSVPSAYLGGSGILYDAILCCNHIFQEILVSKTTLTPLESQEISLKEIKNYPLILPG